MKVIFKAQNHEYFYGSEKYTSVTKLFDRFKPEFDKEFLSSRSTLKELLPIEYKILSAQYGIDSQILIDKLKKIVPKEIFEGSKKELLAIWEEKRMKSLFVGTKFHKIKEEEDIMNCGSVNEFTGKFVELVKWEREYPEESNEAVSDNLYEIPDGYYPEFLMFSHKDKLAGQSDRIFIETINGDRFVDIGDWKTDKSIAKGYFDRRSVQYLFYPLNRYENCNYNVYTIKMSLYAYMLESFGFIPRNIGLTHVKLFDDFTIKSSKQHKLNYVKEDVKKLLEVYEIL